MTKYWTVLATASLVTLLVPAVVARARRFAVREDRQPRRSQPRQAAKHDARARWGSGECRAARLTFQIAI